MIRGLYQTGRDYYVQPDPHQILLFIFLGLFVALGLKIVIRDPLSSTVRSCHEEKQSWKLIGLAFSLMDIIFHTDASNSSILFHRLLKTFCIDHTGMSFSFLK